MFIFIFKEYDKIKCFKNSVVGWTPEYLSYLGYIVSYGYPTRTYIHIRGNSVAHVCIYINFNQTVSKHDI